MQYVTPSVEDVVGGRYRVVRALGSGGMSAVFEAENTFTNKRVALKWLLPTVGSRPEAKERLLREARAGSRIKHRHVVDIYDVAFEGDAMFLVMALLRGETLGQLLEGRSLRIQAFLQLLLPAMRGVAEAHRQGVLHRDIKPDNIFLSQEVDHSAPVPVVLDFGIAKIEGDALRTLSGSALGTPVFMSFEQIRGLRDLDARVDVYGFGVILYMALTGRLPHSADSWPELVYKLSSAEVPAIPTLRPELPPALSAIVARALERDRDLRVESLEALIAALTPFAESTDDLGETRCVSYERELHVQPLLGETQPATSLLPSGPRDASEPVHLTNEKPAMARSSQHQPQVEAPRSAWLTRTLRARYALPVAGLLAAVLGLLAFSALRPSAPGKLAGSATEARGATGALATVLASPVEAAQAATPPTHAALAPATQLGLTRPDAALDVATSTPLSPVDTATPVPPAMRARRATTLISGAAAKVAAPIKPVDVAARRHRLSHDDFFATPER